MIHPADFRHDEATGLTAVDGMTRLRHQLFPQSLEKGVIFAPGYAASCSPVKMTAASPPPVMPR